MKVLKVTNVLIVPDVESESQLYHLMGFETTASVPHKETVGFAILSSEDSEIMLQTRKSLNDDLPDVANSMRDRKSYLFLDVANLDDAKRAMQGQKLLVPERKTFYGTREIFIQSRSGEIIGFAQKE